MQKRIVLEVAVFLGLCLIAGAYFKGRADGREQGMLEISVSRIPSDAMEKVAVLEALKRPKG